MSGAVPAPLPLPLIGSAVLMVMFTVIASTDGLYFHLWRYRLYARAASRYEHRLHTTNAAIFPLFTYLLFCVAPGGAYLWLTLALALLTLGVESADVLCERESRRDMG